MKLQLDVLFCFGYSVQDDALVLMRADKTLINLMFALCYFVVVVVIVVIVVIIVIISCVPLFTQLYSVFLTFCCCFVLWLLYVFHYCHRLLMFPLLLFLSSLFSEMKAK